MKMFPISISKVKMSKNILFADRDKNYVHGYAKRLSDRGHNLTVFYDSNNIISHLLSKNDIDYAFIELDLLKKPLMDIKNAEKKDDYRIPKDIAGRGLVGLCGKIREINQDINLVGITYSRKEDYNETYKNFGMMYGLNHHALKEHKLNTNQNTIDEFIRFKL